MRVDVDETGADIKAGRVDHKRRLGSEKLADRNNTVALDGNRRDRRGVTQPVENASTTGQDVVLSSRRRNAQQHRGDDGKGGVVSQMDLVGLASEGTWQ